MSRGYNAQQMAETDEPVFGFQYGNEAWRVSIVAGIVRLEQFDKRAGWLLVKPETENEAVLMVAASALVNRLQKSAKCNERQRHIIQRALGQIPEEVSA